MGQVSVCIATFSWTQSIDWSQNIFIVLRMKRALGFGCGLAYDLLNHAPSSTPQIPCGSWPEMLTVLWASRWELWRPAGPRLGNLALPCEQRGWQVGLGITVTSSQSAVHVPAGLLAMQKIYLIITTWQPSYAKTFPPLLVLPCSLHWECRKRKCVDTQCTTAVTRWLHVCLWRH